MRPATPLHGAERRMPMRERLRKRTCQTPQSPHAIQPASPEGQVEGNKPETNSHETHSNERIVVKHEGDGSMGCSRGRAATLASKVRSMREQPQSQVNQLREKRPCSSSKLEQYEDHPGAHDQRAKMMCREKFLGTVMSRQKLPANLMSWSTPDPVLVPRDLPGTSPQTRDREHRRKRLFSRKQSKLSATSTQSRTSPPQNTSASSQIPNLHVETGQTKEAREEREGVGRKDRKRREEMGKSITKPEIHNPFYLSPRICNAETLLRPPSLLLLRTVLESRSRWQSHAVVPPAFKAA